MTLSSPPVAGVWWAHTLDCLYDSLSSPPVAGVWWVHTLDCLSLLSTCSWCVVSALAPLSCGSHRIIQVDAAHWWWLRRDPPPPPHDCKVLWVYNNTQKALYKCIIHSFISHYCTFLTIIITLNKIANFNMSVAKTVNQVLHLFQVAFMSIKASLSNVFPQLIHFKSIIV